MLATQAYGGPPAAGPSIAPAQQPPGGVVEGDEALLDQATKQVFTPYVCRSLDRGQPHPGDIAEASSLGAIPLPPSTYPLWDALPADMVASGKLSQLQLEGILYACAKHCEMLPSGERAGFFIGDGAGVGKGRQISGTIIDNYARGRRRAVWLSTSSDLHYDALRDLRDLGCHVNVINGCQVLDRETRALGLSKDYQEGVLFLTYSTLVSGGRGRSRLQQVIDWLTANGKEEFEGLLVFDECHKAKNFAAGKEAASTKVATTVIELQRRLPKARVLYCSATGVSEVGHMAYMERMGLWGPATAFSDFQAFVDSMKKRGVSFLEMLAMEMKAEGKYVARGLSFKDAEFTEVEAALDEHQAAMYNGAVEVWRLLKADLEVAVALAGGKADVWKVFWSSQQRFFKLLCVSLKVPLVVSEAKQALAGGMAVVIGLQSTGEAAADAVGLEPGPCPGFISPTRELLLRFVQQHFPVATAVAAGSAAAQGRAAEALAAAGGGGGAYGMPTQAAADDGVPDYGQARGATQGSAATGGQPIPECLAMREALLERIDRLRLPPNFLDLIIDELGGPKQVAEMTGRRGRVVRLGGEAGRGKTAFELRAKPDSTDMDSLNVTEKDAFMRGEKLIAIISDAASTGISLHAARGAANTRRRLHLTIELPWSADKAIQQLGRSHRSNQVSAPIYKLVSTRVGGEKRFAAAVARRLQSLGALTRGDRRAASGVDLSESNFDSPLGRKSLKRMYDYVVREARQLPQGVTLQQLFKDCPSLAPGAAEAMFSVDQDAHATAQLTEELHRQFKTYCDIMGVGLTLPRGDTVAEDTAAAAAAAARDSGKEPGSQGDVRRFLNRLLGLPLDQQGLMFNYFAAVLAEDIRSAKAEGKYSEGLADLAGSRIQHQGVEDLWQDPLSGRKTLCHTFGVDRGLSFEDALARLSRERVPGDESGFRRGRRPPPGAPAGSAPLVLLALQKPGSRNAFSIARPNTGASYFDMERDELDVKYDEAAAEDVQEAWQAMYDATYKYCSHGPDCKSGAACTHVSVLSGSVVRVWGVLEETLSRHERMLSRMEQAIRVVRVEWEEPSPSAAAAAAAQSGPASRLGSPRSAKRTSCSGGGGGCSSGSSSLLIVDGSPTSDQGGPSSATVGPSLGGSTPGIDPGSAPPPPAGPAARFSVQQRADTTPNARRPSDTSGSADAAAASGREGGGGGCSSRGESPRAAAAAAAPSYRHLVGVRYPALLLPHVVAMLQSLQAQAQLQQALDGTLQVSGPAALLAAGGVRAAVQPPTSIDRRSMDKAFRAPKTLHDFFRPKDAAQAQQPSSQKPGCGGAAAVVKQEPQQPQAQAGPSATAAAAAAAVAPGAKRSRGSDGGGGAGFFAPAAHAAARPPASSKDEQPTQKQPRRSPALTQAQAKGDGSRSLERGVQPPQPPVQRQQHKSQQQKEQDADSDVIMLDSDEDVPMSVGAGAVPCTGKRQACRNGQPAAQRRLSPPQHQDQEQDADRAAGCGGGVGDDGAGAAVDLTGGAPVSGPATTAATAAAAATAAPKSHGKQPATGDGAGSRRAAATAATQQQDDNGVTGGGGAYGSSSAAGRSVQAAPRERAAAAALRSLQGMGFSAKQAERALWMANGDLDRAVQVCLDGMAG